MTVKGEGVSFCLPVCGWAVLVGVLRVRFRAVLVSVLLALFGWGADTILLLPASPPVSSPSDVLPLFKSMVSEVDQFVDHIDMFSRSNCSVTFHRSGRGTMWCKKGRRFPPPGGKKAYR